MNEYNGMSTKEKLLLSAIDIMSEKGFAAATTKEIALGAGVNEVTLFRHFGTKEGLVKAAFSRFHYADEMTRLFGEAVTWDLEADLLLVSRRYHKVMNGNRKLFMIIQKGRNQLPDEVYEEAHRHPKRLMELLADYFEQMAAQGKVIPTDRPDLRAWSFMWLHHGAFSSHLPGEDLEALIEQSVELFVRGLRP